MIKIIAFIVSLSLSLFTVSFFDVSSFGIKALITIGFLVLYLFFCVLFFFICAFLNTCMIKKKKKYDNYSPLFHKVYTGYVACALSLFGVKIKKEGMEKIPKNSRFLLVQNHVSNLDPMITNNVFSKNDMIFISKASLFDIPFFGKMIWRMGYAKLNRDNSREDAHEIMRVTKWLGDGVTSVTVYPEGKRNKDWRDNKLQEFRPGCFSVATKNHAPIVITTIQGTEHINERLLTKKHKVVLKVVDVLYYEDYKDLNTTQIADIVHKKMDEAFEYQK